MRRRVRQDTGKRGSKETSSQHGKLFSHMNWKEQAKTLRAVSKAGSPAHLDYIVSKTAELVEEVSRRTMKSPVSFELIDELGETLFHVQICWPDEVHCVADNRSMNEPSYPLTGIVIDGDGKEIRSVVSAKPLQ